MYKFKDYDFGFADSETEYDLTPHLLESAFYDPTNIIDQLINGYKFLLSGRKGTGKTAFASKLRLISDSDPLVNCKYRNLNEFQFKIFYKLGSVDLTGGSRFLTPWKLMLLLEVMSEIRDIEIGYNPDFDKLYTSLKNYGLLGTDDISRVVRTVSKKGFRIPIPKLGELINGSYEQETVLTSLDSIVDTMLDVISTLELNESKILIVIDGLDDSLRGKDRQLDTVSGLIRAANLLNKHFSRNEINVKFIVLVRPDVLALCTDTDLNKILRDSKLDLKWYRDVRNPLNSDLMQLVKLRFANAGNREIEAISWYDFFPKIVNGNDSWQFVLEHTLLRPRDVLQFLIECKSLYPDHTSLSEQETKAVLANYSEGYFLGELLNELVGFLHDRTIRSLPGLLAEMEGGSFTSDMWKDACKNYDLEENPRIILALLFDSGYIGQLSNRGSKTFVNFKYRDLHIRINYNNSFLIHRGLFKSLNVN
ncbi:hypothetical protein CBW65_20525 [Tumebacillus avium]|uniref:KAP NTPase domain-containing protein n=1 Tax=Tumebacillus avium TaxID=1903704 RepID=A0A1Y0ITH6_9BACL|nr:hypothetical protein [Tumebacillus avium]ARU63096.1 hypothetical protein CBW65_20525 [Tumebacillus avium]